MTDFKLNSKNRSKVENCPCGKSNKDGKFVPFDDFTKYGYCHSCSKTFLPDNELKSPFIFKIPVRKELKILYISDYYLTKSINSQHENNFINFLKKQFGNEATTGLIELYKIGNSKHWRGANVFWYIDMDSNVRTGKIMLYDEYTCKRIKQPYNHITWVHTKLNLQNENISKCLYGEHLLSIFPYKPIAIVESEKTAIIASLFFPNFIWLATGGIGNLNYDKLKSLVGRSIVLFPDLCAYNLWLVKAEQLQKWFKISVSDYLERNASPQEKSEKYDLADFLLSLDKSKFFEN